MSKSSDASHVTNELILETTVHVDRDLSLLGEAERKKLIQVFDECVKRGGAGGQEVEEFEEMFAAEVDVKHVVAVNSATSALFLSLLACHIGPGDEVLVSPYTFAATAHAILHAGAVPVFADIDPETLCISPTAIRQRISKSTKAIMVVHIGGKPAEMDEIMEIADTHGLFVIEDSAQAHGASYKGKSVGTFGNAGVFSFGTKLMTSLRGGAITTDDADIAATCRRLRYHGLEQQRNSYLHREAGFNMAMMSLQAALLIPQVKTIQARFELRHRNGTYLAKRLNSISGLQAIVPATYAKSNYYMLEILYDPIAFGGLQRDHFVEILIAQGVPVSPTTLAPHPIYRNPSLEKYASVCPVAESTYPNLIVMGHLLQSLVLLGTTETLDEISEVIREIHEHADPLAKMWSKEK